MNRSHDHRTNFEAMEARLVLSAAMGPHNAALPDDPGVGFGTAMVEAVFPEGYGSASINEYVPISNFNDFAVSWELIARYEFGERDQTIATGVTPANTRDGVTISERGSPGDILVRPDVPYALVLRSTAPLAATLSHYDFGSSIGESFTTQRSTEWTFGDGLKSAVTRDYFLVYNPQESSTTATLTLYYENGTTFTSVLVIGALRRGGWEVADLGAPDGAFSARVTANAEIVASHSHYRSSEGRGYGELGQAGGGQLAGVMGAIDNDDGFYEVNGDALGGARFDAQSYLTILNTGASDVSVTLLFILDEANDPPPVERTVNAEPGRTTFTVDNLDLPVGDEFGVVYTADAPVTISGSVFQGQDATGQALGTVAATEWVFGEGYMDDRRGGAIIEDLYIFNPDDASIEVTIELVFSDGTSFSFVRGVDDREFEDVEMHNLQELIDLADNTNFYGIRVTASAPVVVGFEHWDGGLGGGFQTPGMPMGTVVPLIDVLDI